MPQTNGNKALTLTKDKGARKRAPKSYLRGFKSPNDKMVRASKVEK